MGGAVLVTALLTGCGAAFCSAHPDSDGCATTPTPRDYIQSYCDTHDNRVYVDTHYNKPINVVKGC